MTGFGDEQSVRLVVSVSVGIHQEKILGRRWLLLPPLKEDQRRINMVHF